MFILTKLFLYLRRRDANISVMFAIILPVLIATFSLGIDGSRFLIKRARLADALSQGSFAVANMNTELKTQEEKVESKNLVRSYIRYYLPNIDINENTFDVRAETLKSGNDDEVTSRIDYIATAQIIDHPIIDGISKNLPGFSKEILISADSNNGIVRKNIDGVSVESDIVFAVDFSASILDETDDGTTHLEAVRSVVNDLKKDIIRTNSKSKISIVPFDLSIPLKRDDKNEAGGDRLGCAIPYKMKRDYDIDFSFWSNKNINWMYQSIDTKGPDAVDNIIRFMDLKRYDYYKSVVSMAGVPSYEGKYCRSNKNYDPTIKYEEDKSYRNSLFAEYNKINSNKLSCEIDDDVSVISIGNYDTIRNEYKIVEDYYQANLLQNMYPIFPNDTVVDYTGTLSEAFLFNENGMDRNKFEAVFADRNMGNLFKDICKSSFNFKSDTLPNYGTTIPNKHPWAELSYYYTNLKNIRQNGYVISLTNNKIELDKFNYMNPVFGAGTDIISGLLYSAHEAVKGDNYRKIIIIITDGVTEGAYKNIENNFFKVDVCKKITDGIVRKSPKTKEAKIYFVSVINDGSILDNWKKNCVGEDGAFVATDYKKLKDAISDILSTEPTGLHFINKP